MAHVNHEGLKSFVDKHGAKKPAVPGYVILAAVLVPALVAAVVWHTKPGIVLRKDDGSYERSPKKVAMVTVVAALIVWGLLFVAMRKKKIGGGA
jgi:hypothetical protein